MHTTGQEKREIKRQQNKSKWKVTQYRNFNDFSLASSFIYIMHVKNCLHTNNFSAQWYPIWLLTYTFIYEIKTNVTISRSFFSFIHSIYNFMDGFSRFPEWMMLSHRFTHSFFPVVFMSQLYRNFSIFQIVYNQNNKRTLTTFKIRKLRRIFINYKIAIKLATTFEIRIHIFWCTIKWN